MRQLVKFIVELFVLAIFAAIVATKYYDVLEDYLPWAACLLLLYMTWEHLLQRTSIRNGLAARRNKMIYVYVFIGGGYLATGYLYWLSEPSPSSTA